jgi:hypothetical protein
MLASVDNYMTGIVKIVLRLCNVYRCMQTSVVVGILQFITARRSKLQVFGVHSIVESTVLSHSINTLFVL